MTPQEERGPADRARMAGNTACVRGKADFRFVVIEVLFGHVLEAAPYGGPGIVDQNVDLAKRSPMASTNEPWDDFARLR